MPQRDQRVEDLWRDALWKWRWLGWRDSTPAFKVSIVALSVAAIVLVVVAVR